MRFISYINKKYAKAKFTVLINKVAKDIIIGFKINVHVDDDFEYEFKKWQYAIVDLNLFKNEIFFSNYIDTKAKITLFNTKFLSINSKHSFESWQSSSLFKIWMFKSTALTNTQLRLCTSLTLIITIKKLKHCWQKKFI